MKKIISLIMALAIGTAALTGCGNATTYKSYTYTVHDTGETIKVELDTSSGFDLKLDGDYYTVTKDDEDVLSGTFITEDMREAYIGVITEAVEADNAQIINSTDDYFSWTTYGNSDTEYNRIVAISGAEVYALIGSLTPDMDAQDLSDAAYELLSFTKE